MQVQKWCKGLQSVNNDVEISLVRVVSGGRERRDYKNRQYRQ